MFHMSVSQGFTELIAIDLIKIFDENEWEGKNFPHNHYSVSMTTADTESFMSKTS